MRVNNISIFGVRGGNVEEIISAPCEKCYHNTSLMGKDEITLSFVVSSPILFHVGDYITYKNIRYSINRTPDFIQRSEVEHEYNIVFEAPIYILLDKILCNRITGSTKVILTGKLRDFLELLVWNINKSPQNTLGVDSGWNIGNCPDTEYKNIVLDGVNCRSVLDELKNTFQLEYYVSNKTINFVKHIENNTNLTFRQGRGGGLYSLEQRSLDSGDVVTRLYPKGGIHNVIPGEGDENGRLFLPEKFIENFSNSGKVVERVVVFEDIYPTFQGTVGLLSEENNRTFVCNEIDFNIKELAVGSEARVNILTGDLMGKSFEFNWDNDSKKISLVSQEDELALIDNGVRPLIPNDSKKLRGEELFTLTGLKMSGKYKEKAINRLRAKAEEWLEYHSKIRVKYDLEIDYRKFRNKPTLSVGDIVRIKDVNRGINALIRVVSSELNLKTGKLSCSVSNYLDEKWEKKIEGQIASMQTTVSGSGIGGSKSNVDIVELNDAREFTDSRLLSSLRAVEEIRNRALSKTEADTAEEPITFAKGLTTLNAIIQQLAQIHQLSVADVANIAKLVISGELKSDDYSNTDGFKIFKGGDGWNMEIDHITARKTFKTLELVVQRVVHQGGMIIQSPAGGKLTKFYSESPAVWAFYIDTVDNFFEGDFVLCQTFKGGKIKRYWRYVTGYNSAQKIIFIHKADRELGSADPEVGDEIVVLGHKRNPARQNARIINVIGDNAPYTADYKGINNYTLQGKLINQIGNLAGVNDPAFGGNLAGVGIYTKNLYAKGDNIVLQSGKSVEQALSPDSIVSTVKPTLDARFGEEYKRTIDTTQLPQNKYYPVLLRLVQQKKSRIRIERPLGQHLNPNNAPNSVTYAKHPTGGFYTLLEWEANGSAWGASPEDRRVTKYLRDWLKENQFAVGSMGQVLELSCEVVYVRGGSKYEFTLQGVGRGWIEQFFDSDTQPVELFPEGYTYENYIKNRPAYGATEQDRRNAYGRINFAVRDIINEPQVSTDKQLQQLESKIIQKNDQIKLEIHNSVTEEVKSGLTVSENGLMLLGKQIVLAGTTLARNMVLQAIQAQKAEIARVISDDIIAKKIEVRKDGKEMALIDANTSTVRFGEGVNIGDLVVNHNGLRCLNKEYKIESDYAGRGRVAHLSTWFNEPAVWAQADDDTAIVALSKNHSHKFQSNSTVVAIRGKGGVFFNTSQNDYWRMPGVLWCARINKWGTIEREWGDGIKNVSISKIGTGVYRVSFSYSDMPQIYIPQVVPYTNEYWSSAWINSVSDNNFIYETVDTGQGKRDMGVMLTIFGVPAIK